MDSTDTKKVYIDASQYWNGILPGLIFAIGLFGTVAIFTKPRLQAMNNSTLNRRMLQIPNLNLGKK